MRSAMRPLYRCTRDVVCPQLEGVSMKVRLVIFLILGVLMLFAGCTVSQGVESGSIDSSSLGHSSMVADAQSMAVHASDGTPHYSVFNADQVEVLSNLPAGLVSVSKNGISLSSPKDTTFDHAEIEFTDNGQIASAIIDGFTTSISEPISADAETVALFVDYAKQMSADDREKFIGLVSAASDALGEALRAAFPTP